MKRGSQDKSRFFSEFPNRFSNASTVAKAKSKQIDWFASFNNEYSFLMHLVSVGNSMLHITIIFTLQDVKCLTYWLHSFDIIFEDDDVH